MWSSYWKACILGLLCTILTRNLVAAIGLANITAELEPRLSPGARIILPNNTDFELATYRWSTFAQPRFTVVVEVATERDVEETVKYANDQKLPFLAVSGAHAFTASLANFHYGIEIWLHRLDWTFVSEDGDTATIGGGILTGHLIEALWRKAKYAVTGLCECTSFVGPVLGAGHSVLQGKYGFATDQLISMHLVTAEGEILDVSASEPDPDLFWAIQGAGHNFGIVTSATVKIYDIPDRGLWAHEDYTYGRESVESLFETWNRFLPHQPPTVVLVGFILRNASIDAVNPVVQLSIMQENVTYVDPSITDAFRSINPISIRSGLGTYRDLARWTRFDFNNPVYCTARNWSATHFPTGLLQWNATAQRMAYDVFSRITAKNSPFNTSEFLLEGFPMQGVQAVPEDSTAYPNREDNIVAYPLIGYRTNASLDHMAVEAGEALRRIMVESSGREELHAYVNYALGDESPEQVYGYEEWRLEKLKELKKTYDPERRFSYFEPIPI
ncbi:putative FAD-dependent oxygenase [Aspergillus saccharolyticus JOP 1030-1]|uniref:FAD binding domain-containing protein n=1 Tax=Aspergillus saccharolyticus JOP 1030-1 TaxID=1450539 RepID=A0A318ZN77_9EURO|nr:FAD binding domain-containing protein [Aspergillus saccharolyticus JOP 1030-1]PYH41618.1 FAD binding domain-containing protein [Aspergillus saccharolyticus JOP 1030-1]